MKIHPFFLCCFLGIISCTGERPPESSGLVFKVPVDEARTYRFDEVFSIQRFWFPEPPDRLIFSAVQQMKWYDGYWYLRIETDQAPGIFRYDQTGAPKGYLLKQGEGPDAYLYITDYSVGGDSIYILERGRNQITAFHFDRQNRGKSRSFKGYFANAFEFLENKNGWVLFTGSENPGNGKWLHFLNRTTGTITQSTGALDSIKQHYLFIREPNNLILQDNQLQVRFPFNDTIFQLSQDFQLQPVRIIDFGNYRISQDFYARPFADIQEFREGLRKTDYAYYVMNYQEGEDFFLFNYQKDFGFPLVLHQKNQANTRVIKSFEDFIFPGVTLDDQTPDKEFLKYSGGRTLSPDQMLWLRFYPQFTTKDNFVKTVRSYMPGSPDTMLEKIWEINNVFLVAVTVK